MRLQSVAFVILTGLHVFSQLSFADIVIGDIESATLELAFGNSNTPDTFSLSTREFNVRSCFRGPRPRTCDLLRLWLRLSGVESQSLLRRTT